MIQRVQSVYLLLVTVLMSIFLVSSYAEIVPDQNQTVSFYTYAVQQEGDADDSETVMNTTPLLILVLMTGLVSFVNIFLFQNRILQIRICVFNSILIIVQLVLIYFYYTGIKSDFEPDHPVFRIPVILPIISIILNFMAYRAIHHDEALVNSYNRIR
ncbi:MAG: DUF4293 domain-containing protein [Bacteroidales bacterium]|nr:DUF4293 domain-containing protein [Bacteroidales bacterium]